MMTNHFNASMFKNVFNFNIFRRTLHFPLMLLLLVGITGCGGKRVRIAESPKGYNLNQPSVLKLPPALDEISGIVYYPKDKSVLAINDEVGWLYKIFLKEDPDIQK